MFPSPFGDIYFSTDINTVITGNDEILFPSPFGDIYFSTTFSPFAVRRVAAGFRPLSGISISLLVKGRQKAVAINRVSVPFRGYLFLYMVEPYTLVTESLVSVPFRGYLFLYGGYEKYVSEH